MVIAVATLDAEGRRGYAPVPGPTPRLSWTTDSTVGNWIQKKVEIELDEADVATVEGRGSVLVSWPFEPLAPRVTHRVRVRVTGEDGSISDWSDPLVIWGAFLGDAWRAPMIAAAKPDRRAEPTLLRVGFEVLTLPTRATLYATAQGVYQAEVNGVAVDDHVLKPGWTVYQDRLIHESTNVTELITTGENVLGVTLAGGWFTEEYGFAGNAASFYGEQPAVSVAMLLEFADGTERWIQTGPHWSTSPAPIISSSLYQGEHHDARARPDGWSSPSFSADGWEPAAVREESFPTPEPATGPPVRAIEEVAVVSTLRSASGDPVFDFGQNLVGRLRVTLRRVPRGTEVRLRHAEVIENGELALRPLRDAAATDVYIAAGGDVETWEPQFTFHGFRFAQIDGAPVASEDVRAVVVHSDMRRTGWFESSSDLLNRFHDNVVWGMRGNFLSLPTDCPQRDERLGWTGDIQVFSPTAATLFDVDGFLASWLRDLALEQRRQRGTVPFIVPNVLASGATPAAAWGDAATVVPTVLHDRYADDEVLRAQLPSMRAWVDQVRAEAGDDLIWGDRFQFGDWLDPAAPPDNPFDARTDPDVVATAYFYRSAVLVSRAEALVGNSDAAADYARLADAIRSAFQREFVTGNGRLMSDSQTGYALAIVFDLVSPEHRTVMGHRLAGLVRAGGYRIGTGFVGTPIIGEALTITGHPDTASRLMLQTGNPSWLYSVTMGATTVWERWDSLLPDGTVNAGEMTSFNHYALGGIADWLHRSVAGLDSSEPGYRRLHIAPVVLPGLDFARSTQDTPYGRAEVGWSRDRSSIVVTAIVPPNATAVVSLPGAGSGFEVGSGTHRWSIEAPRVDEVPPRIDATTRLSDIADDEEAFSMLMTTISAVSNDVAETILTRTRWTPGRRLGELTWQLPRPVRAAVESALEDLNRSRD